MLFAGLYTRLDDIEHKLNVLFELLLTIKHKEDRLMTIVADVQTSLDKFKADFDAYKAGVADAIAKAVADALAKGDAATSDALTAVKAEIDAMDAEIVPTAPVA
jgi:hypothetical protein